MVPALTVSAPAKFTGQLLKWIGNKQRFAREIAAYFPDDYRTYIEPFLGSGAVLAAVTPHTAVAGDTCGPLIGIFETLRTSPETLAGWYAERIDAYAAAPTRDEQKHVYGQIRASYNQNPNPADFVFLVRAGYGGLVRFRLDGHFTTACGAHTPITSEKFAARTKDWHQRTTGAVFRHAPYQTTIADAGPGDLVYCDPPYAGTQPIVYGAQTFSLADLYQSISAAKARGAKVALSLPGTKRSGTQTTRTLIPDGLFEREAHIGCGTSMLHRFQMRGETLDTHEIVDRLLLTW